MLFPHCDLHVALHGVGAGGTPALFVRVKLRQAGADPLSFDLTTVLTRFCEFEFFAPFNAVGRRFENLPSINAQTGLVTAATPGVYLFQVRVNNFYTVGRLQVHDAIHGWWFGNNSITTAIDPTFAHAQPSIYASFSSDAGTDPVGDITGHGYVPLTSSNPAVFVVAGDGRLRGVSHDTSAAHVSGTFIGMTQDLPVHVENYGIARNQLDAVRAPNVVDVASMHNMLFIAEGFRETAADRDQFDAVVTGVVDEMFTKPRHQPYPLLEGSCNVWKAYFPSREHGLTCGFRINEKPAEDGILQSGVPIPYNRNPKEDKSKYTVEELVLRVGLPQSNENGDRPALVGLWVTQNLDAFDAAKVDDDLIKAWKAQKTTGILDARDTFLGFTLGSRPGDRISRASLPVPQPAVPNGDNGDATLIAFVKRVYEFYDFFATRVPSLDPRRHPPELSGDPGAKGDPSPGNAVLRYVAGLHARSAPNPNVGQEWQPSGTVFKRSKGLIAVISNDDLQGGASICKYTMTANTIGTNEVVDFEVVHDDPRKPIMRRKLPDMVAAKIDDAVNVVAHEFGHSFNLLDEYETFGGNDKDARFHQDFTEDNVTRLGWIFANGTVNGDEVAFADETIDPTKVKWLDLMRMEISDVLLRNAEAVSLVIKLTIDKAHIGAWVTAKNENRRVFLRAPDDFTPGGQQLPLSVENTHFVSDREIGAVDPALGTVLLVAAGLPPIGSPVFKKGAVLFIPRRSPAPDLKVLHVVEPQVIEFLKKKKEPLNRNSDTSKVNDEEDDPRSIPDFAAPCKGYRMIGIYEGAVYFAGRNYRPAGICKMRTQRDKDTGHGEFCHVCKWLIVNRVNPSLHAILDDRYFPEAKGPEQQEFPPIV